MKQRGFKFNSRLVGMIPARTSVKPARPTRLIESELLCDPGTIERMRKDLAYMLNDGIYETERDLIRESYNLSGGCDDE